MLCQGAKCGLIRGFVLLLLKSWDGRVVFVTCGCGLIDRIARADGQEPAGSTFRQTHLPQQQVGRQEADVVRVVDVPTEDIEQVGHTQTCPVLIEIVSQKRRVTQAWRGEVQVHEGDDLTQSGPIDSQIGQERGAADATFKGIEGDGFHA